MCENMGGISSFFGLYFYGVPTPRPSMFVYPSIGRVFPSFVFAIFLCVISTRLLYVRCVFLFLVFTHTHACFWLVVFLLQMVGALLLNIARVTISTIGECRKQWKSNELQQQQSNVWLRILTHKEKMKWKPEKMMKKQTVKRKWN